MKTCPEGKPGPVDTQIAAKCRSSQNISEQNGTETFNSRRASASSKNAGMSTQPHSDELERLALTAADVARLLDISQRHLWALHSSGRLPQPIRLGRSVRWNAAELRNWLAAGAPERSKWEAMRTGRRP